MAGFLCHVLGGAKQVRLGRTVRLEYACRSRGKTLAPALNARRGAGRHSNAGKPRPDVSEGAEIGGQVLHERPRECSGRRGSGQAANRECPKHLAT
jgi:hypothetical protein